MKKVKPTERGFVLAEGEVTGHAHCVAEKEGITMFADEKENLFIKATQPFTITHEEHNNLTIKDPVLFDSKIGRVLEYDHFAEEARPVAE